MMTTQELYQQIEGDYQAALKVMMMDSLVSRMIVKLPNDSSCAKLLEAGETMDATGLFEGAHALKGVTASLGLLKLSQAASEICEEFRPGKERSLTDDEVRARLAEIRELHQKAVDGILAFSAK